MTADGKIASANRAISSFGSARDQRHLLELRATADAVMAGARTVDSNEVTLGPGGPRYRKLRRERGLPEYNLRIIVSRSASVNPRAKIFQAKLSPIIVLTTSRASASRLRALREAGAEIHHCGSRDIDWPAALTWLRANWKVHRLLCEGGGEVNDSLFRARVVDELHLTICPLILGGRDAPTIADGRGVEHLAEAFELKLESARRRDGELFLVFRRAGGTTATARKR